MMIKFYDMAITFKVKKKVNLDWLINEFSQEPLAPPSVSNGNIQGSSPPSPIVTIKL